MENYRLYYIHYLLIKKEIADFGIFLIKRAENLGLSEG